MRFAGLCFHVFGEYLPPHDTDDRSIRMSSLFPAVQNKPACLFDQGIPTFLNIFEKWLAFDVRLYSDAVVAGTVVIQELVSRKDEAYGRISQDNGIPVCSRSRFSDNGAYLIIFYQLHHRLAKTERFSVRQKIYRPLDPYRYRLLILP